MLLFILFFVVVASFMYTSIRSIIQLRKDVDEKEKEIEQLNTHIHSLEYSIVKECQKEVRKENDIVEYKKHLATNNNSLFIYLLKINALDNFANYAISKNKYEYISKHYYEF